MISQLIFGSHKEFKTVRTELHFISYWFAMSFCVVCIKNTFYMYIYMYKYVSICSMDTYKYIHICLYKLIYDCMTPSNHFLLVGNLTVACITEHSPSLNFLMILLEGQRFIWWYLQICFNIVYWLKNTETNTSFLNW